MNRFLASSLMVMLLSLVACEEGGKTEGSSSSVEIHLRSDVPTFNGDTAYQYVQTQLEFGPRVPNSEGHAAMAIWLVETLEQYGAKVKVQNATVTAYDQTPLYISNIFASYNPGAQRRVLISAHWDTRPVADQDDERQDEPIPGANDGASGVAVLLEMARLFQQQVPEIGVDLAFWDAEDYGNPNVRDSYALGSQYWARNKHVPNYRAIWGINLDMVGAKGAEFPKEGRSLDFNALLVERVWKTAKLLGYGTYFVNRKANPIVDDHVYVSMQGGVPMIDIIDIPRVGGFFQHWHTHDDDLPSIDPETMKAVGQTVLQVIYDEGVPRAANP